MVGPEGYALPPFFTDESIPDSVGDLLLDQGYEVYRARDLVAPKTADAVIARLSNERGTILVVNDAHLRRGLSPIAQGKVSLAKLRRLHRIAMLCREIHMARRMEELLPAIEFEFARYQEREDKRMFIVIGPDFWRSQR